MNPNPNPDVDPAAPTSSDSLAPSPESLEGMASTIAALPSVLPSALPSALAATPSQLTVAPRELANTEADDDDNTENYDDDDEDSDADFEANAEVNAKRSADNRLSLQRQSLRFEDVVSGQYDAQAQDPSAQAASQSMRPMVNNAEAPKLHKVLAQAGLGSRLEMEQLITEGRISVNNQPAHIGQRIQAGDQIKINGKPIRVRITPPPSRVIVYHKPAGEVVTHDDPQNRPTVFRKLPRLTQGKWQSVGRLDLNTEGLLLFTNSGELANRLMHPRFGLEREYAVRVLGALSNEEKQRLLEGIALEDGMARVLALEDGGGEGANAWYRITLAEGRNREVRRLFDALGHAVSRLIRIRYGTVMLPRGLPRGAWNELPEPLVAELGGQTQGQRGQGRGNPNWSGDQGAGNGGYSPGRGARSGLRRAARRAPGSGQGNNQGNGQGMSQGKHQGMGQGNGQGNGPGNGFGNAYGNKGRGRGPGKGFGNGQGQQGQGQGRAGGGSRSASQGQPDPMRTSLGYISADGARFNPQPKRRQRKGY